MKAAEWLLIRKRSKARLRKHLCLGDVTSTPNAKTAATARKQAPIVAENLIAAKKSAQTPRAFDGYGSFLLTVEQGKIIPAE